MTEDYRISCCTADTYTTPPQSLQNTKILKAGNPGGRNTQVLLFRSLCRREHYEKVGRSLHFFHEGNVQQVHTVFQHTEYSGSQGKTAHGGLLFAAGQNGSLMVIPGKGPGKFVQVRGQKGWIILVRSCCDYGREIGTELDEFPFFRGIKQLGLRLNSCKLIRRS